ncbi:MAG: RidA family protein [Alphaproteobacteria bacterium]|nr:RidA family protein [Alphaproteobacteria bacterium]
MPEVAIFNPASLSRPLGQYSQIARVRAREFVFIAGQVAVDIAGNIVGADDFDAQCTQVFANIKAGLDSVGAGWGDVVQFTSYLVDAQDVAKFMEYRARSFPGMFPPGAYPPNTLLIVDRLVQELLRLEVQTVAAL